MPAITSLDLSNAKLDVDHIAAIATSTAQTATDRLGHTKLTVQGAIKSLASFTPRGARVTGAAYNLKDIYTEGGIAYVVVVQSFTSVSLSSDIASGNVVIYQRPVNVVSARDYGAVLDGITDDSTAITEANAVAGGGELIIDGVAKLASHVTLTAIIRDTTSQIFTENSLVTIDNGLPIRPEWFGMSSGVLMRAHNALPSSGGTITLRSVTYPKSGCVYGTIESNSVYFKKPNVCLQGSGFAKISQDCKTWVAGTGTVIEGMVLGYADNFSVRDLCIDSGDTVCQRENAGAPLEGLLCTYPSEAQKSSSDLRIGLDIHNVKSLCQSPTASVHAIIAGEGYSNISVSGECVAIYGLHGVVFKGSDFRTGVLQAYMNGGEGVIIKSASQTTARAIRGFVLRTETHNSGPVGTTPYVAATGNYGLFFHAEGGNIDSITVESVFDEGHKVGVADDIASGKVMLDVRVGSIRTVDNSFQGVSVGTLSSGLYANCSFGAVIARNSPIAFRIGAPLAGSVSIITVDSVYGINCGVAVECYGRAYTVFGTVVGDNCTYGVVRIKDTSRPTFSYISAVGGSGVLYTSDDSGLTPSLTGSWVNVGGGNSTFAVSMSSGHAEITGLVRGGAAKPVAQLPFWARPTSNYRVNAWGNNAGTIKPIELTIDTSGVVSINENSGTLTDVSTWLSINARWPL